MIIGLTGAHRTGKTTLARAFAAHMPGMLAVDTPTSIIMRTLGYDPAKDYPIETRLNIQNEILSALDHTYSHYEGSAIFDRTPLDAAAYMLADVQRENVPAELNEHIVKYVERCIDITNRRFSMVLFVPPALKLQQEEGKAPATAAYVEHVSLIINGLRGDMRVKVPTFIMPASVLTIEHRVRALQGAADKVLARTIAERSVLDDAGVALH